jgi:hypothetical protein
MVVVVVTVSGLADCKEPKSGLVNADETAKYGSNARCMPNTIRRL